MVLKLYQSSKAAVLLEAIKHIDRGSILQVYNIDYLMSPFDKSILNQYVLIQGTLLAEVNQIDSY